MVDYDRSQLKCLMKVLVCRDANRRVLHNHNIVPVIGGNIKNYSYSRPQKKWKSSFVWHAFLKSSYNNNNNKNKEKWQTVNDQKRPQIDKFYYTFQGNSNVAPPFLFIYLQTEKQSKTGKKTQVENPKNTLFFVMKTWKANLIAIKDTSPPSPQQKDPSAPKKKSILTSKVKNDVLHPELKS